jgi:hypothetical protein
MRNEQSLSKEKPKSVAEMQEQIKALVAEKRRIDVEIRKLEDAISTSMTSENLAEAPQFSEPVTIPLEWFAPANDTELLEEIEVVMQKLEKRRGKPYPDGFLTVLKNQLGPRHESWMDPETRYADYKIIAFGDPDEETSAGITGPELMKEKYPGWEVQDFKDIVDFMETENPAELLDQVSTKDSAMVAKEFAKEFDAEFEENAWDARAALKNVIFNLLAAQDKYKGIHKLHEETVLDELIKYIGSEEERIDGDIVTNLYFMDEHIARTKYAGSDGQQETTCNQATLQVALVKFFSEFKLPREPYNFGSNPF